MNRLALLAVIAALFMVQAYIRLHSSLILDAAYYVYVAKGILAGQKLYVDFVDVNPPIGFWLTVPPIWLSQKLGLDEVVGFDLSVLAITAASLALACRYLKWASTHSYNIIVIALTVCLLFIPIGNFGEREHWMVLLFLPWVMLRLAPPGKAGVFERCIIGLLAGTAVVIKPQDALAPLFLELSLLYSSKSWRRMFAAENLAAGFSVVAWIASVFAFAPAYVHEVVPLAREAYYSFFRREIYVGIIFALPTLIFMAIAAFNWRHERTRHLLAVTLGFLLGYLVQAKGFSYQILPATMFGFLAAIAKLSDVDAKAWTSAPKAPLAGLLTAAILVIFCDQNYYSDSPSLSKALAENHNTKSVYVASVRMAEAFPVVVEQNLRWTSRYPHLWLIPYVSSKWQSGTVPADPIVALALRDSVSDLVKGKPDLLMVDQNTEMRYVPGGKFDFLGFWGNDPRFADFLKDYEQSESIGHFAIFRRNTTLAQKETAPEGAVPNPSFKKSLD